MYCDTRCPLEAKQAGPVLLQQIDCEVVAILWRHKHGRGQIAVQVLLGHTLPLKAYLDEITCCYRIVSANAAGR